jgi:hypothetical protein
MKRITSILPLALLASATLVAPSFAQSPDAPKPPKDDVLGGPSVPQDGTKGNGGFVDGEGRARRPGGQGGARNANMPFAEVRALGAAVKTLTDLTPETKTTIETELKTFGDAAKKWEEANAEKLKAIQAKTQEARKAAQESGGSPDPAKMEEIRKEREALLATAPQTKPVVDKVMGMLSPEQQKLVREKMRPAGRGPGGPGGPGGPAGAGDGAGPGGPDGQRPGRGGRGGQGGKGGNGGNPTGDKPMNEN